MTTDRKAAQAAVGLEAITAADGTPLCRVRADGEVRLYLDRCPHRGNPISLGTLENGVIRCAVHGWEFSAESGELVSPRGPFGLTRWNDSP